MDHQKRSKGLPFVLSALIIVFDQISKALVVRFIAQGSIKFSFFNDFLWLCHVRNTAIGFSLGERFPDPVKKGLFIVLPLAIMALIAKAMYRSQHLNRLQTWLLGGILGGGIGNVIDRIFRAEGVVDFLSVKVYGLFGLQRWPTFNFADATIVVTGIILFVNLLFFDTKATRREEGGQKS
jgi:signal peptidase II